MASPSYLLVGYLVLIRVTIQPYEHGSITNKVKEKKASREVSLAWHVHLNQELCFILILLSTLLFSLGSPNKK